MNKKKYFVSAGALLLILGNAPLGVLCNSKPVEVSRHYDNGATIDPSTGCATISSAFNGQVENVSGTSLENPFVIFNESEFARFVDKIENHAKEKIWPDSTSTVTYGTAFYRIENDIDMNLIQNFNPLLTEDVLTHYTDYTMTIDGTNHTIKNISLHTIKEAQSNSDYSIGFFAAFSGTMRNLNLEYDVFSTTFTPEKSSYSLAAGGVAGVTVAATINNVHVTYTNTMKLTGNKPQPIASTNYFYVGGLVGFANFYSTIINCTVDGNDENGLLVTSYSRQGFMGAITGFCQGAKVYNCGSTLDSLVMQVPSDLTDVPYKTESFLGFVSGGTVYSDYRNIFSFVDGRKSFTSEYGECSYYGLTFGTQNTFDKVYVNDKFHKTTEDNDIYEYTPYTRIAQLIKDAIPDPAQGETEAQASIPVHVSANSALNHFTYGDECSASYGYELSHDTTVNSSKKYYTLSGLGTWTNPAVFTEVATPSGDPSAQRYFEKCAEETAVFSNIYSQINYNGTLSSLANCLNQYREDIGITAYCNEWYFSAALNDGLPFMPKRYENRIFAINFVGLGTDYEINDSHFTEYYTFGEEFTLPTLVVKESKKVNFLRTDTYEFEGWYKTNNFVGGKKEKIEKNAFGDVTVYAKFGLVKKVSQVAHFLIAGAVMLGGIAIIVLSALLIKHKRTYHKKVRKNDYPF